MKTQLKIERRNDDREFIMKRSWPASLAFEDDPIAAKPELKLNYLSRQTSYSDTSSLLGNSSELCLGSPFRNIGA